MIRIRGTGTHKRLREIFLNLDRNSVLWEFKTIPIALTRCKNLDTRIWLLNTELFLKHRFIHGGVLYGGLGQASSDSDQVYVLSLPAFHWLRANYTSTYPRAGHTCHATTTGQMILIGGLDPSQATPGASIASAINGTVDPWNQTIGVFDMPFLEWKKSYDADAEPYTPPVAVKQYYSQGYVYFV